MAKQQTRAVEAVENNAPMSAYEQQILATIAGWEKISVGFAPYLKVSGIGGCFFGKLAAVDLGDPEFPRYVVECLGAPLKCQRGPVNDAEEVIVQPGEFFTVSKYAGLPIERFMDIPAFFKVIGEREVPPNEAHKMKTSMFLWEVTVSPESKALMAKNQKEELLMLKAIERRTINPGDIARAEQLQALQQAARA